MRLLLIEDQPEILNNLVDYFEMKGHTVDCAKDGISGLHLAVTQPFDLIILDIMLPGMDGYKVCKRLREDARIDTPIIMLTARDDIDDRVHGLQSGADDYLVKPFSLSELNARAEAILRRVDRKNIHLLQVDDLCFDMDSLEVTRQSRRINLNPIGLRILEKLMKMSPNVVRKSELEYFLWGEDIPDSDSLRTHIHSLRQAVDKPFDTPLIHTVHGIGYVLKASAA
ncbi:MAG: response regulator transcription factor [Pseudomonadales bacterium]|nr:response regulator transcription factor [Pseudomonadales bacterium]